MIATSPKILSVQEGETVTFTCSGTGQPIPMITWSRTHGRLPTSRSAISGGKLTVLKATEDDSGSYVCNAANTVTSNSSYVELKVFRSLVRITNPTSFVALYAGQALKLSVSASSESQKTLWMYDGTTSLPQEVFIEAPGILLFPLLHKGHVGNYSYLSGNSLSWNVSVHVSDPETCSTVKLNVSDVSNNYVIDPDGDQSEAPFTVYCNMTDKRGVGVTVVSHNSESRTHVNGFNGKATYRRDIQYIGASFSQIKGLIDASKSCEQFIKYECKYSKMKVGTGDQHAYWVSRDGVEMTYWGGASLGCKCGVTDSCAKPGTLCNCDRNDNAWRKDSGLLTNKSHLPVSQLRFGDTGHSREEGYHTLGKFKCFGMN